MCFVIKYNVRVLGCIMFDIEVYSCSFYFDMRIVICVIFMFDSLVVIIIGVVMDLVLSEYVWIKLLMNCVDIMIIVSIVMIDLFIFVISFFISFIDMLFFLLKFCVCFVVEVVKGDFYM